MATLKDVAQASGLTVGTVSRVLNNRGYISDKTRRRVYQVMKELNYQPNEMARSLSKQKNHTIGVILPHIEHPYFAKLLTFLEREARKQGYRVTLFNSRSDEEREEECIEMCKSSRVAGVVLCSGSFETERFKELGFPLVTVERSMDTGIASVECDNYQGGVLATEHLIGKGCRKLLYIGGLSAGENVSMPANLRKTAFCDTCKKHQAEHLIADTDRSAFETMEYYEVVRQLLKENPGTDGIFASSDVIAAYVLQVCRDQDIRVPEELKLVGFDDINVAKLTSPPLTTIQQPLRQMAEASISVIAQVDAGKVAPTRTIFPVTLVERGTT